MKNQHWVQFLEYVKVYFKQLGKGHMLFPFWCLQNLDTGECFKDT